MQLISWLPTLHLFTLQQVAGWMFGSGRETSNVRLLQFSLCFVDLRLCIHSLDDWKGHGFLGHPKKSADNCDAEVILTGLHWRNSCNDYDIRLITTYRHHGIQYVLIHGLSHKKF
jgi:hypothetical protein